MTTKETLKELIDQLFGADYANVERFLKSLVNLNSKRTLHGLSGNLILYDADLEAWAQEQARASRAMDWAALDVEHLAEEVESLGNEQEYAVTSHLRILLLYLLKWRYQPDKRSESWTSSIGNARDEIEDRLVRNPGICPRLDVFLATIYPRARRRAQRETSLPLATFSETRLWGISQIINEDFWPAPPNVQPQATSPREPPTGRRRIRFDDDK